MWDSPGKTKRSACLPASRSAVTLSTAARNSSSAASNSNGNRTLCAFLTSDILSQKDGALVVMPGQPIAVSRLVKAGPSQAACSFSQQQPLTIPAANLLLRSEEHTSELQSLMRISYAVFCFKKKTHTTQTHTHSLYT